MTSNLTAMFNDNGARFMGSKNNLKNSKVGIFGVPYDGTTCFRPGARFGPSEIRNVSNALESFCPQLNLDLEDLSYVDLGCLEIPFGAPEPVIEVVKIATNKIIRQKIKPLILGGEHSITLGSVQSAINNYPELIIVQLDAHADLRNKWLGSRYNHACVMRRCLDLLPSRTIFQVGIRSGTKEEFKELKVRKQLIPYEKGNNAKQLNQALLKFQGKPIYLTVDLDWFDPSVMPGTGTPEPGGFFWQDFASIMHVLKSHNVVAADVVELAPNFDTSQISSILAAKVTRSLIMLLSLA